LAKFHQEKKKHWSNIYKAKLTAFDGECPSTGGEKSFAIWVGLGFRGWVGKPSLCDKE
jgi:hypothetical protein